MKIEINNPRQEVADEIISSFLQCCGHQLIQQGLLSARQPIEMSIAVVDEAEMTMLNKQNRNIDQPTDVLSFCYENNADLISGEIIICPTIIRQYAIEDGLAFADELKKNLAHGLLHNLGFDHEKEMFELQAQLLAQCRG